MNTAVTEDKVGNPKLGVVASAISQDAHGLENVLMSTPNKRTPTPAVALLLAVTVAWCASSAAATIPVQGDYRFTVLRDGTEVGTHAIVVRKSGAEVHVDVETHINVKLPFVGVSVYHFDHKGREVWREGALAALDSKTDDDGEAKALKVSRDGDGLWVEGGKARRRGAGNLIPASLWHPELVHQSVLLNTLDGQEMAVSVADQGTDRVAVHGEDVDVRHFIITGGLNRELWYAADDGTLVKIAFAAKDGSRIEYVLK